MRIEHDFEYPAHWTEIADEFCANDSEYQAEVINGIGLQFKIWEQDKTRTSTHIQLLEIAEQLNDKGRWFIDTINDYMRGMPREELSSVKPQEKTGYWIEEDMFDGDVAYRCSECDELFWLEDGTPKDNGYDFCPKCGARMVEPQESEDKE